VLTWQGALGLAAALVAGWLALQTARSRIQALAPYLREAALVAVLYAVWQLLLDGLVTRTAGAASRGRWVWSAERSLHLPSEAWFQSLFLPHRWFLRLADLYYAGVHFPVMGLFLLWMFARHRAAYPRARALLVVFTAAAALVQAVPVAPPRLVPGIGVVDAAALRGQSVYPAGGLSDPGQLIAMPSVHVGFAALVAYGAWRATASRWRILGLGHLLLTVVVVVSTGNHYWADGLVALVLLALSEAVVVLTWSALGRLPAWRSPGGGEEEGRPAPAGHRGYGQAPPLLPVPQPEEVVQAPLPWPQDGQDDT